MLHYITVKLSPPFLTQPHPGGGPRETEFPAPQQAGLVLWLVLANEMWAGSGGAPVSWSLESPGVVLPSLFPLPWAQHVPHRNCFRLSPGRRPASRAADRFQGWEINPGCCESPRRLRGLVAQHSSRPASNPPSPQYWWNTKPGVAKGNVSVLILCGIFLCHLNSLCSTPVCASFQWYI